MRLKDMFVEMDQATRTRLGQQRPSARKMYGVARAELVMAPTVPQQLRVGVFKYPRLEGWVRFSNDTTPAAPQLHASVGMGIRLFGVAGETALGERGDSADFILQNCPVSFVDNAQEMVEFTYAGVVEENYLGYLARHPKALAILDRMEKPETSVLTATYWAILPFRCGQHYVKYRLEPDMEQESAPVAGADLALDLARRLAQREYRFRFMLQLRTNPETMPLDRATQEWPESESAFIHVATLILPQQDVGEPGPDEVDAGQALNIWRVPPEQAPVGSIAEARKLLHIAGVAVRQSDPGQA